jgi:hypothetical protein
MTMGAAGRREGTGRLRCAVCGEPIKPGRAPGVFVHASRVVAACDLDADHVPQPADQDRTTTQGET